jgi:hypothetical protein
MAAHPSSGSRHLRDALADLEEVLEHVDRLPWLSQGTKQMSDTIHAHLRITYTLGGEQR